MGKLCPASGEHRPFRESGVRGRGPRLGSLTRGRSERLQSHKAAGPSKPVFPLCWAGSLIFKLRSHLEHSLHTTSSTFASPVFTWPACLLSDPFRQMGSCRSLK